MPTKKPRIYVTFDPITFECLRHFAKEQKISMSACASRILESWVDRYQQLSEREQEKFLDKLLRK